MRLIYIAAPLLALLPFTGAAAQSPRVIEAGETITVKASKTNEPDFFAFAGRAGEEVRFDLEGSGQVALMLFTSEGEEMLHAAGAGDASLTAFLPNDGAFMVAVSQADPAGYALQMSSQMPDEHMAYFSRWVGYAWDAGDGLVWSKCWVRPGVVHRWRMGGNEVYSEIGRGGRQFAYDSYPGNPEYILDLEFDGQKISFVATKPDGSPHYTDETVVAANDYGRPDKKNVRFAQYLCD